MGANGLEDVPATDRSHPARALFWNLTLGYWLPSIRRWRCGLYLASHPLRSFNQPRWLLVSSAFGRV